mmetsp:Transcript_27749/g.43047  ORF Transcript_27749/g.43047 Transcript_27749/m.43047 type:complete len:271 (-) Transcript_27749:145-957(-)
MITRSTTTLALILFLQITPLTTAFQNPAKITPNKKLKDKKSALYLGKGASLKPAANPLLDSGKALARSGELLVEHTKHESVNQYGGALSSAGAAMRNAGDYLAQAAASMRFKTGMELVISEMREAGDCLLDASNRMNTAVEEIAVIPENEDPYNNLQAARRPHLVQCVQRAVDPLRICGDALEATGAAIMQRRTVPEIGSMLERGAYALSDLVYVMEDLARDSGDYENGVVSAQRLGYAAMKMKEASELLMDITPVEKPKGKGWLKGGLQ